MLIEKKNVAVFNQEELQVGGFLRAKYHSWDEPRNGLVAYVSRDVLKIFFLTAIGTSGAYYRIEAREVLEGKWQIIYSADLQEVIEWNEQSEDDY